MILNGSLLVKKKDSKACESRFFDRGSFQGTLSGWAQTVAVGRARLGGIPMGCIAVKAGEIKKVIPPNPANPSSVEQKIMEAGLVPNSSSKTAQSIEDFNQEELPLRESMILDRLLRYKQPVFFCIIPNGELCGGAWVVLGPKINLNGMMEMKAKILKMMDHQYAELKTAT
ncbi:hypothetical protein MJO28_001864 [Puccinia striiformis f. sp. tritici]|uniref:Acetyl-coenzyme A carboxylase carboxyl transferase subunit beta domain-containing protein n=2 Tax=Puccinia striiformis TaxID=27350 RepID=A0A2S4V4N2_9BASI|nr:hypothetical protein MJO28_001864 [Puccinia striiformis f. sp. tritici]POW04461.1 hypothetical protein PSTT_10368 [Puccinia striiformis]